MALYDARFANLYDRGGDRLMARKEILTPIDGNDPRIGLTSEGELIVPSAGIRTACGDPVTFATGTAELDPFAGGDDDIASAAALRTLALHLRAAAHRAGRRRRRRVIEVLAPTCPTRRPSRSRRAARWGYRRLCDAARRRFAGADLHDHARHGPAVREDTGDIYIDDAVALYAALETEVGRGREPRRRGDDSPRPSRPTTRTARSAASTTAPSPSRCSRRVPRG